MNENTSYFLKQLIEKMFQILLYALSNLFDFNKFDQINLTVC